ncbi:MAG TPA: NAAT family transporter [Bdellovibrionales bacterium]|nr:NAAT family transporter [Bdellovibrionales bacterium]
MFNHSFLIVAFSAIFTIVNPLGAVGPFLSMTARDPLDKRRSTAKRACLLAAAVLAVCAAVGSFVFQFFGITLPALKIAGGVLLFMVAIDMLNARESGAKTTKAERDEGALAEDIAIFPLGIPLLSGPGAMVSVFILIERAKTPMDEAYIYLSIVLTMLISYIMLNQAGRLAKFLGATGINVMSRMMGLILAAIAVQFILNGVLEAMPALKG